MSGKKNIFSTFISLVFLIFIVSSNSLTPINPLLSVGKDIYCQFDKYNNTNYVIKKSGTGLTTVYKIILPTFEAQKVWTVDGKLETDGSTVPIGATLPQNFIPVEGGEEFLFFLYGVSNTKNAEGISINITPVAFFDGNDKLVGIALNKAYGNSKLGKIVTVPQGAKKMHITNYNNQGIRIYKILKLTDKEIDNLPYNEKNFYPKIEESYNNYQKDRTVFKKVKKGIINFSFTCYSNNPNEYVDFFLENDIPVTLVFNPENFVENCKGNKETRLDVSKRLIKSGKGEVLPYNNLGLLKSNLNNYTELYRTFIRPKQYFNNYGLDASGLYMTWIDGQSNKDTLQEKWVSSLYSFSDRFGIEYGDKIISSGDVYYFNKYSLSGYKNNTEEIKKVIDTVINERKITVFLFATYKDIS